MNTKALSPFTYFCGLSEKRLSLVALVSAAMVFSSTAYGSTYTLTEIVVPGLTNAEAWAINKSGAIVGYGRDSSGNTTGFLDVNGTFSFISFPGSPSTQPSGINDAGDIVGTYSDSAGTHGFKYSGGVYTTIDAPSPALPNTTTLTAINNSGQIAGNAPNGNGTDGFVDTGGSFAFLPFQSGQRVNVRGLNDSGEIVGDAGGVSSDSPIYGTANGYTQVTGQPNGAQFTAVNNGGKVALLFPGNPAVTYILASPTDPDRSTSVVSPGSPITIVHGLNDSGTVVGQYFESNSISHAFIGTTGSAPSCVITGESGPPRQVDFTVQDSNSGLNQIVVRNATNSNINIPSFTPGTKDPVLVTATASDPSQVAIPGIFASNVAGAGTSCTSQIAPGSPVWTQPGGIIESNISIGTNRDGSLEAFGVGTDSGLWHTAQSGPGGAFGPWSKFNGPTESLSGDPVVFSDSTGALQVLITSGTGALWNAAQPTPGNWNGAVWKSVQSGVKGNAAVAVDASGVANAFVVNGSDGSLEWLTQHTSSSSAWSAGPSLGGIVVSNPAALLDDSKNVQVYGVGEDNALWNTGITSQGTVVQWTSLGGSLQGNPAVISSAGNLYAFGRGTDRELWFASRPGGGNWGAWQNLNGVLANNPRAVTNSDGRVEAFVSGTDNTVWHRSQVAAGSQAWTNWSTLGGIIVGDIFPIVDSEAILDIFVLGSDRSLWELRQPLPDNWQ